MSPEVRRWFGAALNEPVASRGQFLAVHCADDEVRREVISLLDHDAPSHGDWRGSISSVAAAAIDHEQAGDRVGVYQLKRLLGHGGMGRVWEAERVDGTVAHRVAIKFLDGAGALSTERFLRERQILASLHHSHIAALHDAGSTADGRPYVVMELVEGTPIDVWCDRMRMNGTQRVQLLRRVADAVQYAHQQLVVHRDLKPSNILVTAAGEPKLLDFGIAKDLRRGAEATELQALTPEYASPEQVLGQPVSAATDVYGLGALLYRLLTGRPPRQAEAESIAGLVRAAESGVAVAPAGVGGDLENILARALHPDPSRRYGSVREFADDLDAFLHRRPVRATPDSAWYRFSQFARRRWMGLAAGAAVLGALTTGVGVAWREAQQTRLRAAQVRQLSQRLLFDIHKDVLALPGSTAVREKITATAAEYLKTLAPDARKDPDLAADLIAAYTQLGQMQGSLGDTKKAMQTMEEGIALADSMQARGEVTPARAASVVNAYTVATMAYGHLRKKERLRATLAKAMPLAAITPPEQAALILTAAGRKELNFGSAQESLPHFDRAGQLLRQAQRERPSPGTEIELSRMLADHGQALAILKRFDDAERVFGECIGILEPRFRKKPDDMTVSRMLEIASLWAGRAAYSADAPHAGKREQAAPHYQRALELARQISRSDTKSMAYVFDWAKAAAAWAGVLEETDATGALQMLEEVRGPLERTPPGSLDHHRFLLAANLRRASALARLGQRNASGVALAAAERELNQVKDKIDPKELAAFRNQLKAVAER